MTKRSAAVLNADAINRFSFSYKFTSPREMSKSISLIWSMSSDLLTVTVRYSAPSLHAPGLFPTMPYHKKGAIMISGYRTENQTVDAKVFRMTRKPERVTEWS